MFVAITGIILGLIIFLLSNLLFPFVTNEEMVKKFAQTSIIYLALTYFLCGIMEVESQLTRGMGKSTTAMFISLVGNCVLRIVWLKIFPFVWWTIRSQRGSLFSLKKQNKWLLGSAALALVLTTVVIEVPFLAEAFEFAVIGWEEYAIAFVLGLSIIPLVEMVKLIQRAFTKK